MASLVTVAIAVVLAGACGVWVYRELRDENVEIHNDTDESLLIFVHPGDTCPVKLIAPHSKAVYKSGFPCTWSSITFSSPYFIDVECSWLDARARQPVIVRPDLVSCQDGVPMPASPPQRRS